MSENEAGDMMSGSEDEEEDLEMFLDLDPANFHEYDEEDDEGKLFIFKS